MTEQDVLFVEETSAMLERIEIRGMDRPPASRIGLRSGTVLTANGVRLLTIDGMERKNYEVIAYQTQGNSGRYDEVRFLASDVEFVTRLGLEGVSPDRAAEMHSRRSLEMIEIIMSPEREETMERFRVLGAKCSDTRPQWFVDIVNMQIAKFDEARSKSTELDLDTLKALLSDDVDEREATAAVMIIMIDMCYNALEHTYQPYIDEDEWTADAMQAVDRRLDENGV